MIAKTNFRKLTVLAELLEYIVPLTQQEFRQLEKNILKEGCLVPITIWKRGQKEIIVDGHNRYKICTIHNLPFEIETRGFSDIHEVKAWMVNNQLGRRNLTPDQVSYYRGLKYMASKRKHGGYDNVKSSGQNELSTRTILAKEFNVSESTIKRDVDYAKGVDKIGESNSELKEQILTGKIKVKKSDIRIIGTLKKPIQVKNEADLHNKAKIIREQILEEVDKETKRITQRKIEAAQDILNESEPLFLDREDRLRKIKGRILSAVNKAIKDRDEHSIELLQNLIQRLHHLILEDDES